MAEMSGNSSKVHSPLNSVAICPHGGSVPVPSLSKAPLRGAGGTRGRWGKWGKWGKWGRQGAGLISKLPPNPKADLALAGAGGAGGAGFPKGLTPTKIADSPNLIQINSTTDIP